MLELCLLPSAIWALSSEMVEEDGDVTAVYLRQDESEYLLMMAALLSIGLALLVMSPWRFLKRNLRR